VTFENPTSSPALATGGTGDILTGFIAVFAGDFIGYWRHRLEHSQWLWPSHAIHHSDTEMTWLTLLRFHPINRLSSLILDYAFLLMLGLPPYALIVNNLVRHYYGMVIHADLPWTYGRLLDWTAKFLAQKGCESPRLLSVMVLAHTTVWRCLRVPGSVIER